MILSGYKAEEMFSFRSPSFKKLALDPNQLSSEEMIELMAKEPRLIRRPIVQIADKVYFGVSADTLNKFLE